MLVQPGWSVLQSKSPWSSLQTRSAATTNTSTLKTKTTDSQMRPKAVEYLLTPLRRPWRNFQSIGSTFNWRFRNLGDVFLFEYCSGRMYKHESCDTGKKKVCNYPENTPILKSGDQKILFFTNHYFRLCETESPNIIFLYVTAKAITSKTYSIQTTTIKMKVNRNTWLQLRTTIQCNYTLLIPWEGSLRDTC